MPKLPFDRAEAEAHLRRVDRRLARVMDRAGACGLVLPPTPSLFEALARSITYQQLSGLAAGTIWRRVRALFAPDRHPTPEKLLALPEAALRGAGLSRAKLAAVQDLARHALAGTVPTIREARRLPDAELVERLTVVRGIGEWTVQMLLIFRLGRPDVLPVADLGVRKGFQKVYRLDELPDAAAMAAHAERWRPYRSVGTWYMWRSLEH